MIRFATARGERWVGLAWNYSEAVLITTVDFGTYTEARERLGLECQAREVELKWFDGEHHCQDDCLLSLVSDNERAFLALQARKPA